MRGRDVVSLGSIAVWFTKPVTGVAAADLLVNGAQATAVSEAAGSAGPYRFSGWATPAPGAVLVTLLPGAIRDVDSKPFAGDAWGYVLHPHPVINELLASNNTVIADEFGDFDDYIEIFNPASISIDLGGMHLTDSLALPSQYPIPAGMVIAPLGHLLFWADGEPSEGATHTNFTLLRAGEQIGLFDADLMPIDTLSYATQTTDVPWGRFPDGGPAFVPMPPTPAAPNTLACSSDAACDLLTRGCSSGICAQGLCVAGAAPDGTPCDDGNSCTFADACFGGSCVGAIPVPADVTNLRWGSDKVGLGWDPTAGPDGEYDLARGDAGELPVGAGSTTCLELGLSSTSASDPLVPNVGGWFWYLVRGGSACFPGTWGYEGDRGTPSVERFLSACP